MSIDEFKEEGLDAQLSNALSQKRKLEELGENEHFKLFMRMVEEQIEMRIHASLVMPNGMDDVIKRIYASGEIAGMKIAINLPRVVTSGLEDSIKFIRAQLEQKEGNK